MASQAGERAATVMPSTPRLTLSTTKPLGSSQQLDINATTNSILPHNDQGESHSVIKSAPEPWLRAAEKARPARTACRSAALELGQAPLRLPQGDPLMQGLLRQEIEQVRHARDLLGEAARRIGVTRPVRRTVQADEEVFQQLCFIGGHGSRSLRPATPRP